MPVSFTNLLNAAPTGNVTSFTTSSFTPVFDSYVFLSIRLTGSATVSSISDTQNGRWVQVFSSITPGNFHIWRRITPAIGTSMTATVTQSGSSARTYNLFSVSDASGQISTVMSSTGTTTIPTVTTQPAINAGDGYISFINVNYSSAPISPFIVVGSGFTLLTSFVNGNNSGFLATQYRVAPTNGTASAAATKTSGTLTATYNVTIVAYQKTFSGWGIPI